jgi:hypothetical protein
MTAPPDAARGMRYLARFVLAHARNCASLERDINAVVRETWPTDRVTPLLVQRAATTPATTTGTGWADSIAATTTRDVIVSLGPTSAAAQLLAKALVLELGQGATVSVPNVTTSAAGANFVGQAAPIPAKQLDLSGTTLTATKFGVIFALTREIIGASTPNAETLVRQVASENIGLALDAALFDANAATVDRPAGLLRGLTTLGATSGTTADAMRLDLGKLANAVMPISGEAIAFVTNPATALKMRLAVGPAWTYPILSSGAIAANTVIAVGLNVLAVAIDPAIKIDTSTDAIFHLEDTTAGVRQIGVDANATSPVRSMFQTDSIGIKLVLRVNWALRDPSGAAFISSVTW